MENSLPQPIDIVDSNNDRLFERAYDIFISEMLDRSNRPTLFGKFIFIDERLTVKNKEASFWHVASIGSDDTKYDMFPCENHIAEKYCVFQCQYNDEQNYLKSENSIPCIFRAHKVNWIRIIIELANNNRRNVHLRIWKRWVKTRRGREKRLFIRYVDRPTDYVLIFSIVYNHDKTDIAMYKFITAYPVVLKSFKFEFNKDYEQYGHK
ncbi:hypothetical protein [Sporolactobacillus terrae]|uniref:hypothetical protein n=1 Tax=Sporolactobacillus terrae TaxID=269673 RepID=UPI00048D0A8E|nr:hypothetical protein [Sporolactobacillus terrae]